jgi:hypothetical protein
MVHKKNTNKDKSPLDTTERARKIGDSSCREEREYKSPREFTSIQEGIEQEIASTKKTGKRKRNCIETCNNLNEEEMSKEKLQRRKCRGK